MTDRIPELPRGKSYHFFVCYESNSLDVVQKIVENLENEGGVKCCVSYRDFIPGLPILENIHKATKESLCMLIVLSKEFEDSNFCKHELLEAKQLMVEGEYNLIPIRIEPCAVPESIRHLVYIDIEDCFDTAHVKIIDAMTQQDMRMDLKRGRNGESQQFKLQSYKPSILSFTRYRLKFDDSEKAQLWFNEYEVSADILQAIENTVNGSLLVKYLHVWSNPVLTTCAVHLYLLVLVAIVCLIVFISTSGREKAQSFQPIGYALSIGLLTWLLSFIVNTYNSVQFVDSPKGVYSVYPKACKILDSDIWKISNQYNSQTGVIFFLKDGHPLEPFQFARYLDKNVHLKRRGENNEECTTRVFGEFLSRNSKDLEISSTKRYHHMTNGAKCVCLLVEEWLKTPNHDLKIE